MRNLLSDRSRGRFGNRRGQALAMAAVTVTVVIAMGALAVDLSMAFAARAAAQRAADAAALAGAAAFLPQAFPASEAADTAEVWALEYAERNDVLARPIEADQVTVTVLPTERKVRVRIEAQGLPTWFARVLGILSMDVAASAAAEAAEGGTSASCVLPFAIPDLWDENTGDLDGDNIPDPDEEWAFTADDGYSTYDGSETDLGTCGDSDSPDCFVGIGLGSNFRNYQPGGDLYIDDIGRPIYIKEGPQSTGGGGGLDASIGPGNFIIWEMPDPDADCQGRPGANWVNENIQGCNACDVFVAQGYETQPGNIAKIKDGLQALIDQDPGAHWDEINQKVTGSIFGGGSGEGSPRIRVVPLWDPNQALQGKSDFEFNNFAKIFIESGGTQPPDFPVVARFMGPISGGAAGPSTGTLVLYLRLVE